MAKRKRTQTVQPTFSQFGMTPGDLTGIAVRYSHDVIGMWGTGVIVSVKPYVLFGHDGGQVTRHNSDTFADVLVEFHTGSMADDDAQWMTVSLDAHGAISHQFLTEIVETATPSQAMVERLAAACA